MESTRIIVIELSMWNIVLRMYIYSQGNPQALPIIPILPIGYFFFNEIPKLGQKFLLHFPFLGVLRRDYYYAFPDQGVTFIVDLLASFTHR